MNVVYSFHPSLSVEMPAAVAALLATVLQSPVAELAADLRYQQQHQPVQAWLAYIGEELVGCKLGYERKPGHYYSWLGGVHPDFRGQGIAAELMRQQHAWCREQGYQHIRTHTYNRWRAMLLLNLRHGFNIIGTMQGTRGLTIVLEKELAA
ncbi:GNAT family N-acetyltransferase [Microvirga sp. STR05]|uniref:GNAT family N-acetyltransferase n=1 Tax=Hymenobacter duratus TaxID=2771356 RepID=A0ABR8JIV0_9BACT|nr:GNAT family N-acetyltransferase [Hymenobacter duratus]MBD2715760.1 GNAT family N-acetyltransferase [Hymenobacter duratus]MBR7950671.1 GNAT family N-acetyltransferase [Microvirga sp. STR05]